MLPMEALQSAFWSLDPARTVAKFEAFATLAGAVKEFNAELASVVEAIRTANGLTDQLKRSAA